MDTSSNIPDQDIESKTSTNDSGDKLHGDANRTTQDNRGFFKRLKTFVDETEASVSWIAGLITMAGLFVFLINYINAATNRIVSEKVSPYEKLLSGQALVAEAIYDDAIPDLEVAFNQLDKKFSRENITGGRYYQIIDSYLLAMVNSESPELHEHRFKKILKLQEENKFSFLAWHHLQIGWYYFRTGHLEKASKNFLAALDKYKGTQNPSGQSNSYWALALVAICEGDLIQAKENYQSAYSLSEYYSPDSVLRTIKFFDSDSWYRPLIDYYDIEEHLPGFAEMVQATERFGGVIRGS